jgi:hypothetical protein
MARVFEGLVQVFGAYSEYLTFRLPVPTLVLSVSVTVGMIQFSIYLHSAIAGLLSPMKSDIIRSVDMSSLSLSSE